MTADDGHTWGCFGRTSGGRQIAEIVDADIEAARIAGEPDGTAGIRYGRTGIAHQAANRILLAGGVSTGQNVTVSGVGGYWLTVSMFGVYGLGPLSLPAPSDPPPPINAPSPPSNVTSSIPQLLIKSAISSGRKTIEGKLIEAVELPWFDIIELLRKDPTNAYKIPPDKWEEIIATSYVKAGFDEVILTPRSGDYGRDVIATLRGIGYVRVIDQVKAYRPGHLVTADDVRALYGVVMADGASKGFLTTTSDFAPRLSRDILLSPLIPSRIELINGPTLLMRLFDLARKA